MALLGGFGRKMAFDGLADQVSCIGVHSFRQDLGHLVQLRGRDSDVHADAHVRLELRVYALQRRKHAHGGQLAALPVEDVSLEDVPEELASMA